MAREDLFALMADGQKLSYTAAGETGICTKEKALQELVSTVSSCSACSLRETATQAVFGVGDVNARLMFVGEGPGAEEDRQGLPFVGTAGKLLDRILEASGFSREEVYIANIVKCRPPGNRLPAWKEAETCLPYLKKQIELIGPSIIVCLGALATQALVDRKAKITKVRGTWFEREGIKIMPTFHPAALLRDPSRKKPVWEDMQQVQQAYRHLSC